MLIKVKWDECDSGGQERELDIIEDFVCLDMGFNALSFSPRVCRLVFVLVSFFSLLSVCLLAIIPL